MIKISLLFLCAYLTLILQIQASYNKTVLAENFQASDFGPRIIDGMSAEKTQFPWQVLLKIKSKHGYEVCGGSLVDSTWVLTAAHCVEKSVQVVAHLGVVEQKDPDPIIITVGRILRHPKYDSSVLLNDIALLRLSKPVTFSDYVQPIKLAKTVLAEGVKVTASGWGKTNDTSNISRKLNYVTLVTISNQECSKIYGSALLTGDHVCAKGEKTQNTCQGDSGGPLITGSGAGAELVGIVSFSYALSCSAGYPSGYTRVAPYAEWIVQNIVNKTD